MFSCFVSIDKTYEIMLSMMGFMLLFQIVDHVFSAPIHSLFMDLNFDYTTPNVVQTTYNEPMCLFCIYDYCPFWGPFAKKICFHKKEFSNEIF
jgi:hypothetical protein